MTRLLSASEFAVRAGVSRTALQRALDAGSIPGATKIGNAWTIPEGSLRTWKKPQRGRPRESTRPSAKRKG